MTASLNEHYLTSLSQAVEAIQTRQFASLAELEDTRRLWLGKSGKIKEAFRLLKEIGGPERAAFAAQLNSLQVNLESFLRAEEERLSAAAEAIQLANEFVDLTLPGTHPGFGKLHPITHVERHIDDILRQCGFKIVYGPELETEFYCFDALNIPKHHPARDMQDTFFTEDGLVLRTHTTSVQARILEKRECPLKIASRGRVYRNETEDADHRAIFHQYELIWLDSGLTLAQLMGLITFILRELYGKRKKIRFVPKFYPYTEPSIGAQIEGTTAGEWATVAGAGMIHPKVLEGFGYDPKKVSGIAFGLGTSRLAAQSFDLPHLRDVYAHDMRILGGLVA